MIEAWVADVIRALGWLLIIGCCVLFEAPPLFLAVGTLGCAWSVGSAVRHGHRYQPEQRARHEVER